MKLRFYFDYSDYRSYLMMHALRSVENLPVSIQWFALDAYSLRALCGTESRISSPLERRFMKQEAMRYCEREGLEFVWQEDDLHLGTPLRVGVWLMAHRHASFETFSRKILDAIWARGKKIEQNDLRNILNSLDIDYDEILKTNIGNESFQIQDAMLHEAMADGVFDVPAVLIGDHLVCHFDQAREIRRLAILECLQNIPQNIVYNAFTESLMALPGEACQHAFSAMTRKMDTRQSTLLVMDQGFSVQHSLDMPNAPWMLPKSDAPSAPVCHICASPSGTLNEAFSDAVEGALNFFDAPDIRWSSIRDLNLGQKTGPLFFCAPVIYGDDRALLMISMDERGKAHVAHALLDHEPIETIDCGSSRIAGISPSAQGDLNLARLAAFLGAHLICRINGGDASPVAEASAAIAQTWIIEFSKNGIALVDAQAHKTMMRPGETRMLTPQSIAAARTWIPAAPRTLLLCEQSFSLGEISENADLELAVRGVNLLATATGQGSEISPNRVFEKIRIRNANIILIPLASDQIFRTESVSQRFIQMLNRAPRDGMPFFINFWSELEFEMLEYMRPVLSATAQMFQIPTILVVGSQIVEIWIPGSSGSAWRIEKEDDRYTIDLAEAATCENCFDRLLSGLNASEDAFIERLRAFEKAPAPAGI